MPLVNLSASPATELPAAAAVKPQPSPARLIKAEANLLRFPIFALSTKGLKNVDQIQCVGTKREGTQEHRFRLTVSRNTRFVYPGPLARKVHFALLSIVYEQGFPFNNPVGFTWRDLARRIQSAHGGDKIDRLKEAIRSIHGVVMTTEYALKSGTDRQALPSRERGYHLYSDFVFSNDELPDGSIADRNYVWFSDWYLANLNSFYTAPIDYHLWRTLNERSPIASRLYEFLLFNFAGRHPQLTINYAKLAQFLPVRVERFLSKAREQLDEAMELLQQNLVTKSATWTVSKANAIQLRFAPGPLLSPRPEQGRAPAVDDTAFLEHFSVREIRTQGTPSETIVRQFYRLWAGHEQSHPVKAEIAWADELLDQYGRRTVELLLPAVVKSLKPHSQVPRRLERLAAISPLPTLTLNASSGQRNVATQRNKVVRGVRGKRFAGRPSGVANLHADGPSQPGSARSLDRGACGRLSPNLLKQPQQGVAWAFLFFSFFPYGLRHTKGQAARL